MTTTSTSRPSSSSRDAIALGRASVRWTGRAEGDLRVLGPDVEVRRAALAAAPWCWVHQVHGGDVHVVTRAGEVQGADGDALVTDRPGVPLAVFTADCAPVALSSAEGVAGVAHAGWRGLAAGVIEHTVAAMRDLGATDIVAALGPCIRPGCYEFGAADLDDVAAVLGDGVRGRTADGRPALDLPAAVRAALDRVGSRLLLDHGGCTACGDRWYSHRARGEAERQATVVVIE